MNRVTHRLRTIVLLAACALAVFALPARAAITYFDSNSNPADNGSLGATTVTIAPPAGMQAGDLAIIIASHREAGRTMTVTTAGGQTWNALTANTTTVSQRIFWARFNGTWGASPVVTFSDNTTTTVVMHVFRPSQTANTWAVDVAITNASFAAPGGADDVTIAGINTATDGALVIASWATADNNTWGIQTGGWANAGDAQYRNQQGGDASQSTAYRVFPAAGATGPVTNRQLTLGGDAGNTSIVAFREVYPTTTLATGTDPGAATIAPGGALTIADNFTLQTASGTEPITSVTVNLSTANGVGRLSIHNNAGTELGFTTTPAAGANVIAVTGMSATSTLGTFSVRVTPLGHAAMPAPNGASYAITAPVTAWAGPAPHAGSDTDTAALTIDNASPNAATALSGTAGPEQVTLNWTTSNSADFSRSVVLRWTGAAGAEVPAEGTDYAVDDPIGAATVACVRTGDAASAAVSGIDGAGTGGCSSAALAGGTTYVYRVFQKDANGNYNTGTTITTGTFTPVARPTLVSATLVCGSSTQVEVLFSTQMNAATAQNIANYALSGGATISSAVLGADTRTVTLTVTGLQTGTYYTLTVNNVTSSGGVAIAPGAQVSFFGESGYVAGLKGTYYNQNGSLGAGFAFTGTAFDRIDAQVNFNWGTAAPGIGTVGANGFSVRWQGYVTPTVTGTYNFRTRSDDGVRLYVGGATLVDNWTDHSATDNTSPGVPLTAGQYYAITMEFYENGGDAVAELSWSGPATGGYQPIPASQLFRCGSVQQPAAFYKLDESSWNGSAGEVVDSSGNGRHGTAAGGAIPVAAKVCNGAQLNGSNRYITVSNLSNLLNATASLAFWIRTTQAGNNLAYEAPGVTGIEQSGGADDIFWGWLDAAGRIGVSVANDFTTKSATAVNDGNWHHVVLTRNHTAGLYKIYIDGALNASGSIATGVIGNPFSSIGRIEDTGGTPVYLNGQLDEVRIYGSVLTDAEVTQIYSVTRTCVNALSHYSISFPNGTAGVTCEPADVLITAHDASDAAIAPTAGTVMGLSTSTGTGLWLTPAVVGTGGWSVSGTNNGVAQYVWPGTETAMRVRLRQNAVTPTLTVVPTGAYPALENFSISFADTAFRVTANGTSSVTVGTHLSGKDTNVGFGAQTLYLQAIRTDTSTGSCAGLIPGQTVNVEMAAARNNPTGGTGQVSVRNSGGGMTALSTGAGVPGSYGNVSLTFDAQSKAPLVINYPDAGTVSISARYQLPATPPAAAAFVSGATGTFVVRPFGLRIGGVTTAGSPAPGSATFAKAGANFNVTVTAVQWKSGDDANADGVPDSDAQIAANAATPNFGQETAAASALLTHTLNAPSGGVAGALGGATTFTGFTGGARTQAVSWSEVGFINLFAASDDYLGSGQDVTNSAAGLTGVGRFYPDHFAVAAAPAPVLVNRAASACSPASTFSYMGEGFTVGFTLQARNTAGAVTQNYGTANGYAKLNPSVIAQLGFGARSGATVLTPRLDLSAGAAGTFTAGAAAVSATLGIARAASPDGPYASVQIGIAAAEAGGDGVTMTGFDLDADGTAGNERRNLGVGTEVRFGRLRLQGIAGSSLVNTYLPLQLQYFNGTGFVRNADDACTTLAANTFSLSTYRVNLNACETAALGSVSFAAGDGALLLGKPGGANNGSVLVTANLGDVPSGSYCTAVGGAQAAAASALRPYLRGSWTGGAWDVNPSGRVAFGVFGGQPKNFIFQRENY